MEIKNLGPKRRTERSASKVVEASRKGAGGKVAASVPASSSNQSESIELTAIARALGAAQAEAANAPFDADRVQEIRDAIAEGRYPINNHRLADKLIELEGLLD
ncbi:flagellar biosynthesis anti-sigma factor FlgM [Rhabdochromatium marinum]|uniref:flagellar biosynthesis anti-sigma factor FlgM n=1 Tax=Rhabdochromatium marinum TaxID=48729 RepID=UPI0019086B81|nr:flagellar biosynthesis anti-sigma factor FlgM [Rhabdochromatium marinum]MBK1647459.1 flagellar biosynthesis anti-sigma factor FlgM [Rhabdochromatium marinum]